jgi:hypothetical protein
VRLSLSLCPFLPIASRQLSKSRQAITEQDMARLFERNCVPGHHLFCKNPALGALKWAIYVVAFLCTLRADEPLNMKVSRSLSSDQL